MKNTRIAVLLTLALLSAPFARAAADGGGEDVLAREDAAGRQWKDKLGLSAEQLPKFLAAVKARDADLHPLQEQSRAEMRKLRAQLSENAPEKDVQDSLEQVVRLQKEMTRRNEQFDAGTASFLVPSQRAKLLVWRSLGVFPGKSAGLEAEESPDPTGEEAEPE